MRHCPLGVEVLSLWSLNTQDLDKLKEKSHSLKLGRCRGCCCRTESCVQVTAGRRADGLVQSLLEVKSGTGKVPSLPTPIPRVEKAI